MDEYFISYYGCESKTKSDTGRRCTKCSNVCEQKQLLCRCRLWDLTEEEVDHFKEKIAESGGFSPVISPVSALKNIIGSYVLHSTKDIPIETLRARQEHVQARENFERERFFDEFGDRAQAFVRFQHTAEDIRKLRYGTTPASCFANHGTLAVFYKLEVAILKNVGKEKIRAVRREKKKLEKDIAKFEAEESELKANFGTWIRSQKQELEAIQKNHTVTVAELNSDTDIDIADLADKTKWRLVSQDDFLNPGINIAIDRPFSKRTLEESRQNGKITWLDESQGIGRDADGRHLKRTGKSKHNFRYCYFLLHEFDAEYAK